MALLKCKMCGGSLEVAAGETIIECEYCGTQQTLPKTTDENIQTLFNRANLLRQKNEFDKAEAVYEKILEADGTEAEAYWGVILCKFGIEYVEDPKTYKRIPTCHRTSYDSIVADEYYKKALEHADISSRAIYEAEAKKIDEIQKGILAIATQEEPYDVFICYKETDENGRRTQDSVIANDIYYQLTQEGFKVFYAAITLEDKLGSAYESIIFAALNSSKVMLSIGTKPEYFSAVWVKNEWSRFLKMMKKDRSKMLIPCYKGMDAYELPEEFAHLQAQDMGKIGFINDIVRGIKKVIVKDEPKTTNVKENVVTSANPSVDPLLKRAFMFLEDKEWDSAKEYAEKVLDIDPENPKAYLVKFLAKYDLKNCSYIVDAFATPLFENESADFKKAMRFADDALREELNGYIKAINDRNEHNRLQKIYDDAKSEMKWNTHSCYLNAAKLFESINAYLDSSILAIECREKAEVCSKNDAYDLAMSDVEIGTVSSLLKAIEVFESISGWKDSDEQIAKCEAKLPELREKEEKARIERERKAEQERIERERKAEQERIEAAKRAKRNKKIAVITTPIICAVIAFIIVLNTVIIPNIKYNEALDLMNSGQYLEAVSAFEAMDGYKDSESKIVECKYNYATTLMDEKKYADAILIYGELNGYKDSLTKIENCKTQAYIAENGQIVFDKWGLLVYGDEIKFGQYEQDNVVSNGTESIEWIVLEVKDGKALVISKYALDAQVYNEDYVHVTWKTSSLRKWLNNDFLSSAFNSEEKNKIATTTVSTSKDPDPYYSSEQGNPTQDKIFVLDIKEAEDYFDSAEDRKCAMTSYASAQLEAGLVSWHSGSPYWPLRTVYNTSEYHFVSEVLLDSGKIYGSGVRTDHTKAVVRPAMWIDLS